MPVLVLAEAGVTDGSGLGLHGRAGGVGLLGGLGVLLVLLGADAGLDLVADVLVHVAPVLEGALQDRLAYGPTFEAALTSLFGGGTSSLSASSEPAQSANESGPAPQPTTNLHGLIADAAKDLEDYQRLTAQGKLGDAGKKLDELKNTIDQLNKLQH